MTRAQQDPPTLRQQIEAIEYAARWWCTSNEMRRQLEAAVETLKTMEFAREVLK